MSLYEMAASSTLFAESVVTNCTDPNKCDLILPMVDAESSSIRILLQIVFGVLGALAVFFVVSGALKFITSRGDPQGVSKAKNTILYALIGLVVAIAAEIIVSFVLENV